MATTRIDLGRSTCEIVSAYVSNNHVARPDLPSLITSVHSILTGLLQSSEVRTDEPPEKQTPVQIRKSITPDALISFIDGKPYKLLRRHLTKYGLDPNSYRARFGLPDDYPLIAANYSEQRATLAKSYGLGKPNATPPQPELATPAKMGLRKKTKLA